MKRQLVVVLCQVRYLMMTNMHIPLETILFSRVFYFSSTIITYQSKVPGRTLVQLSFRFCFTLIPGPTHEYQFTAIKTDQKTDQKLEISCKIPINSGSGKTNVTPYCFDIIKNTKRESQNHRARVISKQASVILGSSADRPIATRGVHQHACSSYEQPDCQIS